MSDITDEGQDQEKTAAADSVSGGGTPADADDGMVSGVKTVNLEDELKQSFIDYAMSVIVDRALPDVRDGLKPVHRRVIYDMYDLKVWHSGQTKKSARIVGDVIGRFHPHGDAAVYETMVRMAQWFSMREPLIFGQGNFGDIDGDGAAAMRYTEVKMTKIAENMIEDIDKDTVDSYANYDGTEQIPEVLPARFPNLLVNGSSGIAVGMATNIPTHNLSEVISGTLAMLDNPEITTDELMHFIPGPDFPTGGVIVGRAGVRQAYEEGRGRCVIRSRTHTETDKSGRRTIFVDEIPYMVHKVDIVKQMTGLLRDKKLEGVAEINDLSDKNNPVRIAIDLKRDAYEEAVLNNLFQHTMLQSSFPINMVALVHNHPRQLSLREILSEFIEFRREVVTRRTVFLLRQDRRKAHVDEGLMTARANIQRVVELITSSEGQEDARMKLMQEPWDASQIASLIERSEDGRNISLPQGIPEDRGIQGEHYFLSEAQARAILALQLSRLTHLAQDEIRNDYKALLENIRGYLAILNNPATMKQVIREELEAVRTEFGNPRLTGFTEDAAEFDKADLIPRQDVLVILSTHGYVKYQDIASFDTQQRGGRGHLIARLKDEDFMSLMVVANTHDKLMCFTSRGRAFITMVYDLPTSANRSWRGRPIQNIFNIDEGETVTAMLAIPESDEEDTYFFLATAMGKVKKISVSAFKSFIGRTNENSIKVVSLAEGDELIGADISGGSDDIYLFTSDGMGLHFCEYYPGADGAEEEADDADEVEADEEADDALGDEEREAEDDSAENEDADAEAALDSDSAKAAYLARLSNNMGVRPSGRGSGTVRGIKLCDGARVVSLLVLPHEDPITECLIVGNKGVGRRLRLKELRLRNRGGYGLIVLKNIERAGEVVGVVKAEEQGEFVLVTDHGQLIRSPMNSVSITSRMATGNILMRMHEDEKIIAIQSIPEDVAASSRRTSEARAKDRQALKESLQQAAAGSATAAAAAADTTADSAADTASAADGAPRAGEDMADGQSSMPEAKSAPDQNGSAENSAPTSAASAEAEQVQAERTEAETAEPVDSTEENSVSSKD